YRVLLAEASPGRLVKPSTSRASSTADDLLPGSVSRLHTFVPERIAQIEELYRELLEQAEARHKAQVEGLSAHVASTEERHKAQVEELTTHYNNEIEQLRQRIMEMNGLLHQRSVNLAEDEKYIAKLTD